MYIGEELNLFEFGVYFPEKCGKRGHAMLIVGYGTDEKTKLDYWIVRNSWSDDFANKGYFRLIRGKPICGQSDFIWFPNFDEENKN